MGSQNKSLETKTILNKTVIKDMLPMQAGDVKQTYANTFVLEKYYHYKPETDLK